MSASDPHPHHPPSAPSPRWLIAVIQRALVALGSLSRSTSVMIMAIVILAESALLVHRRNVELKAMGVVTLGTSFSAPRTIDLKVEFPTGRTGRKEPLLSVSAAKGKLIIFTEYFEGDRLKIGACNQQGEVLQSSALLEPASGPHSLTVRIARWDGGKEGFNVVASMDGAMLFASEQASGETSSLEYAFGRNPDAIPGIAATFSGALSAEKSLGP